MTSQSIRSKTLCQLQLPRTGANEYVAYLFPLLEQLFPLRFSSAMHEPPAAAAIRLIDGSPLTPVADHIPSLTIPLSGRATEGSDLSVDVRFSDIPDVPVPFRGRRVVANVSEWQDLPGESNDTVLASVGQSRLWTVRGRRASPQFISALPLPRVASDTSFSDLFHAERFLALLPLIHFLQVITRAQGYEPPPLRATYIIDDPNLHWPRYGYVHYGDIARRAEKENYHVAFATIPLDTWVTHSATARIFRESTRRLSLLIHGNNHSRDELARYQSRSESMASLRQAIARIERLEQKSGLHVSRVMVPPHGACSSETLAALPGCGFDAACVSTGSLRFHNKGRPWRYRLGFLPCELIEGCAVLPRWGLTGSVTNALLLAAFLGQPMIVRGHHQDLKNGAEVLDELARFTNSFGNVLWCNAEDLARMNYAWELNGDRCLVHPFGAELQFTLPAHVREFALAQEGHAAAATLWDVKVPDGTMQALRCGEWMVLKDGVPHEVTIRRLPANDVQTADTAPAGINAGSMVRRLLTEARDRLLLQ
jgi:hypothetical protein